MAFKRYPAHRKKRLSTAWRRPRGWQNKLRLEKKGHGKRVKVGHRTEAEQRGKKNGLELVTVYNVSQLEGLDKKTQGAVIGNVGMKKEIEMLEAVKKLGVTLLTGDADTRLKTLKDRFDSRKKASESRDKEREEKQKELEKKAEKVEKEAEKETKEDKDAAKSEAKDTPESEEKAKAEKKQKDKVLTKAK